MKNPLPLILYSLIIIPAASAQHTTISSADELSALATDVNNGNSYSGKTIVLTDNLDLSILPCWTPIGTEDHPFCGTFDGQDHEIQNLTAAITTDDTDYLAGLFGKVGTEGVVRDINLTGTGSIRIDTKTHDPYTCHVGAIAGSNAGTIIRCANKGIAVYGNWDNADVGGIAGTNYGTIANCCNLGRVFTGPTYSNNMLGGIAGYSAGTIRNCLVSATVSTDTSGNTHSHPICGNTATQSITSGCLYTGGTSSSPIVNLTLHATADNTTALADVDGQTRNVLLEGLTLHPDGLWNTICLPFDIPPAAEGLSPIAGATVKELSAITLTHDTLTLTFTDTPAVKAGQPYIVRWDALPVEGLTNPVFLAATIQASLGRDSLPPTGFSPSHGGSRRGAYEGPGINLVGNYAPTPLLANLPSNLYLNHANKLCVPTEENFSIPAFQACFLPDNPEARTLAPGDLQAIVQAVLGRDSLPPTGGAGEGLDINGDRRISLSDITALLNHLQTIPPLRHIQSNVGIH